MGTKSELLLPYMVSEISAGLCFLDNWVEKRDIL